MERKSSVICSNKDKRILKALQDPNIDYEDIFYRHILKDSSGCWNWYGKRFSSGYGHIRFGSSYCYIHRVSYILFKGLIPLRYHIDHICNNKSCCNPEHLEAVTPRENKIRAGFLSPKSERKSTEYFKRGIRLDEEKYQKRQFRKSKMRYVITEDITESMIDSRFNKFINNL